MVAWAHFLYRFYSHAEKQRLRERGTAVDARARSKVTPFIGIRYIGWHRGTYQQLGLDARARSRVTLRNTRYIQEKLRTQTHPRL